MSTYSFKIKKGKYELNLQTTDKELLVSQFELWVKQAGDYARRKKAAAEKEIVTTQIKKEEEITKQHIEEQLNRAGLNKKQETPTEIKEEIPTQKALDIFYKLQGVRSSDKSLRKAMMEEYIIDPDNLDN